MQKRAELYRGKAKTLYETDDPDLLILEFRDDTSALDGQRIEQLSRKGTINNRFNYFIMNKLSEAGIPTQLHSLLPPNQAIVKRLKMVPVECVVRNRSTGSFMRRLAIPEGELLNPPIFELFWKNDQLHDPMVNESYCITFGWATTEQLARMRELSIQINRILSELFAKAGIILVDFKLEFGLFHDEIILGDEFSPDGCRLWDSVTLEKLDKDRFRQNLGNVVEAYEEVAKRLGVDLT